MRRKINTLHSIEEAARGIACAVLSLPEPRHYRDSFGRLGRPCRFFAVLDGAQLLGNEWCTIWRQLHNLRGVCRF